jgi:uncharacterized protein
MVSGKSRSLSKTRRKDMPRHRILPNAAAAVSLASLLFIFSSCANYYQHHYSFNQEFENGDLKNALQTLQNNSKEAEGRNRFIYFANEGLLNSILGNYDASNAAFEKAFIFGEDYRINYANEAISYLTNPNFAHYRGENHEHLMVLYFKAINFLKQSKYEEALVECKRLNIRLNQLNDKYRSEEKLQRDAFVHTLMGIIYQASADYNNAFIAYRNAVEVYESDYSKFFHLETPEQLKKDLLNTAYWTGFSEEFESFKTKFQLPDYQPSKPESELVFFWHNGLAPVKDEWSINFVVNHREDNVVVFNNEGLGLSFPFQLKDEKEKNDLSSLEVFRVAFPRYQERPVYYSRAFLETGGATYPLQLSQDINQIAFLSLKQRMMQEFSKGLLRAALKKATEHSVRKENDQLGAVIGLMNAITEKADTRSWQTLPHSIYYARVPMKEGTNQVRFNIENGSANGYTFNYEARKGQTLFHTFSSLESKPVQYRYY